MVFSFCANSKVKKNKIIILNYKSVDYFLFVKSRKTKNQFRTDVCTANILASWFCVVLVSVVFKNSFLVLFLCFLEVLKRILAGINQFIKIIHRKTLPEPRRYLKTCSYFL